MSLRTMYNINLDYVITKKKIDKQEMYEIMCEFIHEHALTDKFTDYVIDCVEFTEEDIEEEKETFEDTE